MYMMFKRFVENRAAIYLMRARDRNFPVFSELEWRMISGLCNILAPIYRATLFVQKRNVGISAILPLFNVLVEEMKKSGGRDDFPAVREQIAQSLSERLSKPLGYFMTIFILKILLIYLRVASEQKSCFGYNFGPLLQTEIFRKN